MMGAIDGLPDVSFATGEDDLERIRKTVARFLARVVDRADAEGVVVPASGGVDSTLTLHLATEALGADRVNALVLPCHKHESVHVTDARDAATDLGVSVTEANLRPLLDAFEDTVASAIDAGCDERSRGNVLARTRMVAAYYAANRRDRLVCGTTNRTELLLGYFTKYGDGAADLRPLAPLYKTEVRALASHVGVPDRIVSKPSTAGFTPDQTDEGDLGAPYGLLDVVLHRLTEGDLGVEGAAAELGLDPERVGEYADRHAESAHKRAPVPAPDLGRDRAGERFHELEARLE